METKSSKSTFRKNIISWFVFIPTLAIVLLTMLSVVFPAFLIKLVSDIESKIDINPYEIGIWAIPFFISNIIIFTLLFLYHKQKLPSVITKPIKFIFNFEISSKLAFFVVVIIIGIYIVATIGELFNGEFLPDFEFRAKERLESYDFSSVGEGGITKHLQLFLNSSSMYIFGNYKVIPFITSISLLALTYFFTFEITQKRFAGIVAMGILLQSGLFLFYDTTVVYPNYWILFYLLSLYLVFKKWPLSSISYVLSAASKGLVAVFFPMTLFFIYRTSMVRRKKILLIVSYVAVVMLGVTIIFSMDQSVSEDNVPFTEFNSDDFWTGFAALNSSLRVDGVVLLFLLPLTVGLCIAARKRILHADSIMFFILTILLMGPFLTAFSDHHNVSYRFVPLIVFFAIGVGILLSKRD